MNAGPTTRPLLTCHLRLGPTTYPRKPYLFTKIQRQPPLPCPCPTPDITIASLPLFFPTHALAFFFFFFSGNASWRRRRGMSTSASTSQPSWPRYGAVPMTRCPDCPRLEPLKRLVCVRSEKGNVGREFVKCESKPQAGEAGKVGFVLICSDFARFIVFSFLVVGFGN